MSAVGGSTQTFSWSSLATVLEFLWELSIGIWLIVKGFNPSDPLEDASPVPQTPDPCGGGDRWGIQAAAAALDHLGACGR